MDQISNKELFIQNKFVKRFYIPIQYDPSD